MLLMDFYNMDSINDGKYQYFQRWSNSVSLKISGAGLAATPRELSAAHTHIIFSTTEAVR
jgi:hypothetical protein